MSSHARTFTVLLAVLAMAACNNALAQHDHSRHASQADANPEKIEPAAAGHAGMDRAGRKAGTPASEEAIDHDSMGHVSTGQASMGQASMDHASMDHAAMDHGADTVPLPSTPIPVLTDVDRKAAFPPIDHQAMQHAPTIHYYVRFNRLEGWDADDGDGQAWEGSAWTGSDLDRLWLRSEGERANGRTEASDVEVLYGRSVSPWWELLVGVKHDFQPAGSQTWAAFGVQGMAPYKFELAATAYVGESGHASATIEIEYELLLNNRLILQPMVELRLYSDDDQRRRVGAGLSKLEAGLRLRYEINRHLAPYLGVVREHVFGATADYHAADGEDASDTRVVFGLRFWF